MNSAATASLPDDSSPAVVVLARLPRIGPETPRPTADAPSESPILVVVDEQPLQDDCQQEAIFQQEAIDALAAAAQAPPAPSKSGPRTRQRLAGKPLAETTTLSGRLFRIHELLAPYSSVIVTIALVAAAGLLFLVASQPTIDPDAYETPWATLGEPAPAEPQTPSLTQELPQVAGALESTSEPAAVAGPLPDAGGPLAVSSVFSDVPPESVVVSEPTVSKPYVTPTPAPEPTPLPVPEQQVSAASPYPSTAARGMDVARLRGEVTQK